MLTAPRSVRRTVEMESPVSGTVIEVAGEVGDVIAIGSALVVIETEGESSPTNDSPTLSRAIFDAATSHRRNKSLLGRISSVSAL